MVVMEIVSVGGVFVLGLALNWPIAVILCFGFVVGMVVVMYNHQERMKNQLAGLFLLGIGHYVLYNTSSPFEIENTNYTLDTGSIDFSVPFYQMYDPGLQYIALMDNLNAKWNQENRMKRVKVQVDNVWGSDPLRFDFLSQYWDHSGDKSPYICIVESDILFNQKFFEQLLAKKTKEFDLIAIQHFWGHHL